MCQLFLSPHEAVRACGSDLECYFYHLAHSRNWHVRNAVGRRCNGSEFVGLGYDPLKSYRFCLGVVAMGDRNGVDIAQAVHEGV